MGWASVATRNHISFPIIDDMVFGHFIHQCTGRTNFYTGETKLTT